ALLFTTATVTASADYLNGEASPAELSTSADPFPGQAAGNEPQQNITIEGPVVLTRYDGPNGPLEVSARDAWITPEPAPDSGKPKPACPSWLPEVLRCKDPPRPAYFHLAPGTRTATTATYQTGTQVVTRSVTKSGGDVAATSHVTRADETVPAGSFDLVLNDRHPTPLVLPPVLVWSPIAQLVWMLAAALTLMFCWVRFRISVAPAIRESRPVPENGPDLFRSTNFTPSGPRFWHVTGWEAVTETRRVRIGGALAHRGEQLLNYTGAITAPIALFLVGLSSTNDLVNAGSTVLYTAANVSMYFVVGLSVVLLALGSKVRTSEGMAKTAGIVWDLTTFWPRSAHPLSPPCYTERVVPELQRRINWARAQDPPYGVVISAHSQGSLISVAALIRRADLSGIRFVSYGSQIRGLYGRAFPGVFGPEVVGYEPTKGPIKLGDPFPDLPRADVAGLTGPDEGSLKRRFGKRWVNLFRRGDPLGYRVFSDVVDDANDRVILEPRLRVAGDPGSVEYLGHSYYMHTPEYRALVAGWTDTTFVLPGSDVAALEPLPER
ncbi:MAG: hypothetical protein JWO46_2733, partial [Nocardioidaceae bacterium]|nr:hypothetical protein [Nocardioidaceae bacterium]